MKNKINKTKKAFSLVEVILYIALASVLLLTVGTFLTSIYQTDARNNVIQEVDSQGEQILFKLTQIIRNANSITAPTLGTSGTQLTLVVPESALSPTVIQLSSGNLQIKEGTGQFVNMNSSNITVSALNIRNLGRSTTKGVIQIEFTISYKDPDNREEYKYTKKFYATAAIR